MKSTQSINLAKLHFLGYCVGVYSNIIEVRVPKYSNLNEFMQNNISYNHTSINTFVLIESNNYFFMGIINKEDMSEHDTKELINDKNRNMTETPELYVNILSEINPISLNLIKQSQHFPVIHSKVYVANEFLINKFISETSKDVNKQKINRKTNKVNKQNKDSINHNLNAKTSDFAKLVQNSKIKVNLSFNTLFGRHLGIVGSTGSGKSYTAAKLIRNLATYSNSQCRYPVILLDPTGEYNTLVNNIKKDSKSVNKFNIGVDTRIPYYDLNDNELYKLIKPSSGIQFPRLKNSIRDLKYVECGCNKEYLDSNNKFIDWYHSNNIVNTNDVKILRNKIKATIYSVNYDKKLGYDFSLLPQQIKSECYSSVKRSYQGERNYGYCASLTNRINTFVNDKFLSKYFCNTPCNEDKSNKNSYTFQRILNYNHLINHDIIYINLSHVTLANSIAEIIGDYIARKLLESFIRKSDKGPKPKHPAVLFLDEAHNFIKKDNVNDDYHLHYFDLIAKEGRKYGLLMTLITQSPNDLSRDVLTQFGTFIIHHLGNDIERQKVASALPSNSNLDRFISSLNTGEAIISSSNMYSPLLVSINEIKDKKYRPTSDTPKF